MIKRFGAVLGALAIVGASAMTLGVATAGATEHGNSNYLGILSAQPPSGYPVSPAFTDISGGPVTLTISVAVQNLTGSSVDVPMNLAVHHILTYQGVDV